MPTLHCNYTHRKLVDGKTKHHTLANTMKKILSNDSNNKHIGPNNTTY